VTLAQSIVAAIAEDPAALSELRAIVDTVRPPTRDAAPVAYTVATLADELGVSKKTVRGAIDRGELEAVKRGGRWLISAETVRAWVDGERLPTARPRRTESVKRSRASGPSLRAVLCDPPANRRPHKQQER
jgi:excisionase family DNA binding protein